MPREARDVPEGAVVHVICRFVDRCFRLSNDEERLAFRARLGSAISKTDWRLVFYCAMSSHYHAAFLTGAMPLERVFRSLNTSTALWLNKRQQRLGPVFASRPTVVVMGGTSAAGLFAYIANNPCRAGVVAAPGDSDWSSYRMYLEPTFAPEWLDVGLGMKLAGFPNTARGRAQLDELTRSRIGLPRDPHLSGDGREEERSQVRRALGTPAELATPRVDPASAEPVRRRVVLPAEAPIRIQRDVPALEVLSRVAEVTGVPVQEMRSRRRSRAVSNARRVALAVWTRILNCETALMAAALGISRPSASALLEAVSATRNEELFAQVCRVGRML